MYLKRIQIQGFKSFADKTVLEFSPPDTIGRLPITAIVGPNGSGKSNCADAVRWVLGEQSVKAIRGKKSEDVIFAGSGRRARSSVAEVQLTVQNDDRKIPLDAAEVTVARRLYRDGDSEYLLNNKVTRLMDIQMLLAKAAFGKEGYSVIGQGQVDQVLIATPEERKAFFDEATGVRPLQIKKDQTLKKLSTTEENLWQAELLQEEIEPRLRSLTRQVKRLEQREEIEKQLHALQAQYFGTLLYQNEKEYKVWYDRMVAAKEQLDTFLKALKTIDAEMSLLEKAETKPAELLKIQGQYEKCIAGKEKLREREFDLKRKLLESKKSAAAVPTFEIIQTLEGVRKEIDAMIEIRNVGAGLAPAQTGGAQDPTLQNRLQILLTTVSDFIKRLKGESLPENAKGMAEELEQVGQELKNLDQELEKLRLELQEVGKNAETKKQAFFEVQRRLSAKQQEVHTAETELNNAKIELAKIETRRESVRADAKQEMGENAFNDIIKAVGVGLAPAHGGAQGPTLQDPATAYPEIQRLKRQLESIGTIDAETMKEYEEVKTRFEFLNGQITDLKNSLQSIVTLLEELERTIKLQFEQAFEIINTEFNTYFKILFGGGQAKLAKITEAKPQKELDTETTENTSVVSVGVTSVVRVSLLDQFTKKDSYRGIDISATPPGKKLKSISMLSGGEKALTSIALISAILALNPPPFVMLDEVDAALDESNSARFASILSELGGRTQFIVITHNRASMHAAEVLYGVTMGDDGVSKILSLKLEQAEAQVGTIRG